MLWLVREGDSYVEEGHHYVNHMSFVVFYNFIYVDHMLMVNEKL